MDLLNSVKETVIKVTKIETAEFVEDCQNAERRYSMIALLIARL